MVGLAMVMNNMHLGLMDFGLRRRSCLRARIQGVLGVLFALRIHEALSRTKVRRP